MAEAVIYLRSGRMHTGHIRDAGSELAYRMTDVIEDLKDGADFVVPATSPLPSAAVTRLASGAIAIGERRKKYWKKARQGFFRALEESSLFAPARKVELRLSEHLDQAGQLSTPTEAKGFLNLAHLRITYLLSGEGQHLNTLVRSGLIFAEDYALRRAVFDGVIFSKLPKQ